MRKPSGFRTLAHHYSYVIPLEYGSEVMMVCSVGGPMDVDYKERVKGKDYKCRSCGEKFKGVGKHPICPSCQSDDVAPE